MANLDVSGFGGGPVDTGATTINDASNYIVVGGGPIILGGSKKSALLTLIVGAGGALAHLQITRSETVGGTHVAWLTDTDFNTATVEDIDTIVPGSSPPNIYQLAANGRGQIKLDKLDGIAEIKIQAKKATADTTLQVLGNVR